jgi:hypothetical protein
MDIDAKAWYKMARTRIMKEMIATSAAEQAMPAMQPSPATQLPSLTPLLSSMTRRPHPFDSLYPICNMICRLGAILVAGEFEVETLNFNVVAFVAQLEP